MNLLICIDDTDNLNAPGTGKLAARLGEQLQGIGLGSPGRITRHQLFVHPDVPYTSHNSTMCMDFTGAPERLNEIISYASDFLRRESAEGADPGLAVAMTSLLHDDNGAFLDYGQRAKCSVLSKGDAWEMAGKMGIHLSEHGGTGDGIIGALAGIALRWGVMMEASGERSGLGALSFQKVQKSSWPTPWSTGSSISSKVKTSLPESSKSLTRNISKPHTKIFSRYFA